MTDKERNQSNPTQEHERKNEGGREFGHVHQPTQAEQASKNHGLDGTPPQKGSTSHDQDLKRPREGEKKTA